MIAIGQTAFAYFNTNQVLIEKKDFGFELFAGTTAVGLEFGGAAKRAKVVDGEL